MCLKNKTKWWCNVHYNQLNQSFKDTIKKELATFLLLNNKNHKHVNWKKKSFPWNYVFVNVEEAGFCITLKRKWPLLKWGGGKQKN